MSTSKRYEIKRCCNHLPIGEENDFKGCGFSKSKLLLDDEGMEQLYEIVAYPRRCLMKLRIQRFL
jgi:hypothetical protein